MFPVVLTSLGVLSNAILIAMVCGVAVTDLCCRRIPNRATYAGFVVAIGISMLASLLATFGTEQECHLGPIPLPESLTGAVACLGVMLLPYGLCRTGAGDVKLACAIGAFLGVRPGLSVLVWCYVLAAFVSLIWIVWQWGPAQRIAAALRLPAGFQLCAFCGPPDADLRRVLLTKMPLGGFFAAGTILTLLGGPLL